MSEVQAIDQRRRAWASDASNKRVRRRYAADRRLQAYGIIAIALAVGLLGILISSLVVTGLPAFVQTKVDLEFYLDPTKVDAKDPAFFSPFPDGRYFFMWQDQRKTLEEIAKFSRNDAEVYPQYEEELERLSQLVEWILFTLPPQFPPHKPGDFLEYLRLAARTLKLPRKDLVTLVKIFTQSVSDYLDEWFESPELKVTLATDGVIGANGGPRSPGTAYILLHHCMGSVGGKRGLWGFVRGGMGTISEAIAAAARISGATIRVNSEVARIVTRGGRVHGVALANG